MLIFFEFLIKYSFLTGADQITKPMNGPLMTPNIESIYQFESRNLLGVIGLLLDNTVFLG